MWIVKLHRSGYQRSGWDKYIVDEDVIKDFKNEREADVFIKENVGITKDVGDFGIYLSEIKTEFVFKKGLSEERPAKWKTRFF